MGLRGFGLLEEAGGGVGSRAGAGVTLPQLSSLEMASTGSAAAAALTGESVVAASACAGGEDSLCIAAGQLSFSSYVQDSNCCAQHTACSCMGAGMCVSAADISSPGSNSSAVCSGGEECSLQVLFSALGSLPLLRSVTVCSLTCAGKVLVVDAAAAAVLGRAANQLTRLQLSDTGLTDAAVDVLVAAGLTRLRRLVLDSNPGVTAAVLPDSLVVGLCELRELSVMRTGIRVDAAAFKARMLGLLPRLVIKSSAR